ncbi:MAG TPA: NAD-dependent epimerase, partial [Aurantimonas sp.]|nr:NAD-dependent epimerase [Aurantimonas sp.]
AGQEAILPVDDEVRHWVASPAAAVGFLLHAATMDTDMLGPRRALSMPGLSVTIAEMIEALREVAGEEVAARIRREPDATIEKIVAGWPRDFDATRAAEAGFTADPDFASIIRAHIADEAARGA